MSGRFSLGGGRGQLGDWGDRLQAAARGGLAAKLRVEAVRVAMTAERESRLLATTRLRVRSGRLRQSIRATVEGEGAALVIRLRAGAGEGRDLPYARAQEEGATIRPKRGRFLAIPLDTAKTPAGVLRGEFSRVNGLREVKGLFVVRTPGHNAVLCRSKGKGRSAKVVPLFVLVSSTKIVGQHYLRDGADAALETLPAALQGVIERVVDPEGA